MATTCGGEGNGMVLCRKAGEVAPWDDQNLLPFLVAQGVAVGSGGICCGLDGTGPFVRVHLPGGGDPSAVLDAYVPPANPLRTAMIYLRTRLATIRATAPANRTTNDNDLLALLAILHADQ